MNLSPGWENIDTFFNTSDFGVIATLQGGEEIKGIFDMPSVNPVIGNNYYAEIENATFTCADVDAKKVKGGDLLSIKERIFQVLQDPDQNGAGTSTIVLVPQY